MPLLNDIAHNFNNNNEQTALILKKLFEIEDEYLKTHKSDTIFGV